MMLTKQSKLEKGLFLQDKEVSELKQQLVKKYTEHAHQLQRAQDAEKDAHESRLEVGGMDERFQSVQVLQSQIVGLQREVDRQGNRLQATGREFKRYRDRASYATADFLEEQLGWKMSEEDRSSEQSKR